MTDSKQTLQYTVITMRHSAVISLVTRRSGRDKLGNPTQPVITRRNVYANELSVSIKEFYEASVSGLKPEKQFEIYTFEYAGETEVEQNGVSYNITRVSAKGDKTRIICQRVVGNGV